MTDGDLFSQGFNWGDDDPVADVATPVATPSQARRTSEKVGFPNNSGGAVAPVATVAETERQRLERALSQSGVASAATIPATLKTAVSCGFPDGAGHGVASVASVANWLKGIAAISRLRDLPKPYPANSWRQIVEDAYAFVEAWGGDAVAFGWSTLDAFGANPIVNHRRLDRVGLVMLLKGRPIQQLDATSALIGVGRDAQTYRRAGMGTGSVPIWSVSEGNLA